MQPAVATTTSARPGLAWPVIAAVAAGGALGAVARHAVDLGLPAGPGEFPTGTLLINVVGCLLVGAVAGLLRRPVLFAFVGPGLLGGFTTLSTYAVQTVDLALRGEVGVATGYLFGTLVLALVAVEAGLLLARGLAHRAHRVHHTQRRSLAAPWPTA